MRLNYFLLILILFITLQSCEEYILEREEIWVFIMAGQSNMSGRAKIESQDIITNQRIYSINHSGSLILAKEPIHFYEPALAGLDCGLSFGNTFIENIPPKIKILMIPTAIGGSTIEQWIEDDNQRGVKLLSNFKEKASIGAQYGEIKGILWHHGESNANPTGIANYKQNLELLFTKFRTIIGDPSIPIIVGELGSFSPYNESWQAINNEIYDYSELDHHTSVISTSDLKSKADKIHFNSTAQRTMGYRFAKEVLKFYDFNP